MNPLKPLILLVCLILGLSTAGTPAFGQTSIMPLGDSITQGGGSFASYRYHLWFGLLAGSYDVDFVGQRDFIEGGGAPNGIWYPDYYSTFDRDHEGYWGWRSDEVAAIVPAAVTAGLPDIVMIHLGTNDVGQLGAAGVVNADTTLRAIIGELRDVRPQVTILLAQIIPIGPGSSYSVNAGQVNVLNTAIAVIAADSTTAQSPIILVDQNTGFNLGTMLQADGLHPNLSGEVWIAGNWLAALTPLLPPPSFPPTVNITAPGDGSTLTAPTDLIIEAGASDSNGVVTEVSFFSAGQLLGTDTVSPYSYEWIDVPVGNHPLTALARDDSGDSTLSAPVMITVLPPAGGDPVTVANFSFEDPLLADSVLAAGPGTLGGWLFEGTANTFVGIFNPPAESYPTAGGNGTPTGADSANVAYLFNNGGPADSVSATQVLADTLAVTTEYTLIVAVGNFLPDQPYVYSTYGGYRIELLAGGTVIARDEDTVLPLAGEFRDAYTVVESDTLDPGLIGLPLSIRLTISAADSSHSTHFDHVRLSTRTTSDTGVPVVTPSARPLSVYPNPFVDRARVVLPRAARAGEQITLSVFDVRGRLVRRLAISPGTAVGRWDGRTDQGASAPAGVYFLRAVIDGQSSRARLVKTR